MAVNYSEIHGCPGGIRLGADRVKKLRILFPVAWLGLIACNIVPQLSPDPNMMLGTPAAAADSMPNCASCHSYPLHDVNHEYHLMSANVNQNNLTFPNLNNVTTCMDCHYNSIHHFSFPHADTTWGDSAGNPVLQHTRPSDIPLNIDRYTGYRPLPYKADFSLDTLRGRFLGEDIDSLIFQWARMAKMVPWRTSWTHDNGTVDIAFPPNDVTSPDSLYTAYKPKDFSCSAISCHNRPAATYRWMFPSKGISHCPSLNGNDPTCNETTP